MNAYQKPVNTLSILETLLFRLQSSGESLIPDCSTDAAGCGSFIGDLGSVCTLNQGQEQGITFFFLPESNLNQIPECTMILNHTSPLAESCQLVPMGNCGGGTVWRIACNYAANTCSFFISGPSEPNTFEISCQNQGIASCDTLPAPG